MEKEMRLRVIAAECQEFEHVISAMGYGYSLLNVREHDMIRRCSDCVNWLGGSCPILADELG